MKAINCALRLILAKIVATNEQINVTAPTKNRKKYKVDITYSSKK